MADVCYALQISVRPEVEAHYLHFTGRKGPDEL